MAIQNARLKKMIEARENLYKRVRLQNIYTRIVKQKHSPESYAMLVHIGFDYLLYNDIEDVNEDIVVEIVYKINKKTGEESFNLLQVKEVAAI